MTSSKGTFLASDRGSILQFFLTSTPLLAVLIYFLYAASQRPNQPLYNLGNDYTDDEWRIASEETGALVRLTDMLTIFLSLLVSWTLFAVYTISFISKRRHLIGRYLSEGEVSVGNVHYDKTSRACGGYHDYGYAIYAHPDKSGSMIRKKVRVFQSYTREKITILRLPNKPLSGQAKIDIDLDLSVALKDRDSRKSKAIAGFSMGWVLFTLLAPLFIILQMTRIDDPDEIGPSAAMKMYLIVAGADFPFAYAMNWSRFLMYRNWLLYRGAVIDNPDEENVKTFGGCLITVPSENGSEIMPYSIMNEDECSYMGEVPNHDQSSLQRSWVQP
jgi:uncharacterized protein with PIN domain